MEESEELHRQLLLLLLLIKEVPSISTYVEHCCLCFKGWYRNMRLVVMRQAVHQLHSVGSKMAWQLPCGCSSCMAAPVRPCLDHAAACLAHQPGLGMAKQHHALRVVKPHTDYMVVFLSD